LAGVRAVSDKGGHNPRSDGACFRAAWREQLPALVGHAIDGFLSEAYY
jgi:hypothetical protein